MKAGTERERKPYSRPDLRRVQLKTEESLAAGCKTGGQSAPAATPCTLNTCLSDGS